jgi:hypothetical protein
MLHLSHVMIANPDLASFEDLVPLVKVYAKRGERFFRMDVKPPYPDTPENWEDVLEAAFSSANR